MVLIQPQMTSPSQLTLSYKDKVDTVTVDLEQLSGARLECEVVEGIPRPSLRWVHQVPLSSVDSL